MRKIHITMISTLKIPSIDSPNEDIITFISGFLDMILKGLKVLNNLRIERPIFMVISMTATITIKKSSFDQLLLR